VTVSREARFWDRIAARYAKSPVADEAAYQKKLDRTREYFRPDMTVLEFGCGTGSTALAHAPYVAHIRATDVSASMIQIAQSKARAMNIENVSFEQVSIEGLDVAAGSQDAVLGLSILHLLADKEGVIAKVHRMLKPGGIFVSSTACLGDTLPWFKVLGSIGPWCGLIPRVAVFTRKDLETSLTAGGFEIDYQWRPGKGKAVFIIARKPG
jgi:ubiquinone/menaquinone biosynthesis C-methylase UbiE